MESTLQNPALGIAKSSPRATTLAYWAVTAIFCLEIAFTAYYEILPQGVQAFARLGFQSELFRVELSLAKLIGVAVLLLPMIPPRLKEWAYAGFAINLISAILAHASIHDQPLAFVPSSITSVLWAFSYFFWRRRQANPTSARPHTRGSSGREVRYDGAWRH